MASEDLSTKGELSNHILYPLTQLMVQLIVTVGNLVWSDTSWRPRWLCHSLRGLLQISLVHGPLLIQY